MRTEDILEMDEDDRPPLLVIEDGDRHASDYETETYQKPEELVGLEPKPTHPSRKSTYEEDLSGRPMDEHTRIVDKAKCAQEEEDARAAFHSPLRGPYDG